MYESFIVTFSLNFPGLLRFQNTLTTNFYKASFTWEIDYYSYKKLPNKNGGFKNLEKSGRLATLYRYLRENIQ